MSTTFSQLSANIADWLDRDDLAGQIPTFISMCEDDLYRELRIEAMLGSLSGTISNGLLAVPADFLALGVIWLDTHRQPTLIQTSLENLLRRYGANRESGEPRYVAREGASLRFGPAGDGYDVMGTYYQRLPALSSSNETNWFTTNAADCLLFGSLVKAVPYIGDNANLGLWADQYLRCLNGIKREDVRARFTERAPLRSVVR